MTTAKLEAFQVEPECKDKTSILSNASSSKEKPREVKYSGVYNAEIYAEYYATPIKRLMIFMSLFLIALAYGLDNSVRNTYQTLATSSYSKNALVSTVSCIEQVLSAACQIWFARAADIYGRPIILAVVTIFYVVGSIIQCKSYSIASYSIGSCIYAIGYAGVILICEVYVADFSNLNWRVAAGTGQILPNVIITWVGGNIAGAINDRWQWGIGMWAFIFPLSVLPMAICIWHMHYLAKKNDEILKSVCTVPSNSSRLRYFINMLIWELNLPGLILVVVILGLILIPLTLGGGLSNKWRTPGILIPEILGWVVGIPLYVVWEAKYATHPLMPWKVVRDRGIWSPLLLALLMDFSFGMQSTYLVTFLLVAVNQSKTAATRINRLFSFISVLTGFGFGFIIVRVRKMKWFIIVGVSIWFVSFGLLEKFRGGDGSLVGIIVAVCLLGFGNGLIKFPSKTSIQACVMTHDMIALATSLTLALNNVGKAFASAVSGAIWTNILPDQLEKYFKNDPELAKLVFEKPLKFIKQYKWGSSERNNVISAYRYVWRLLIIVGLVLLIPLLLTSFFLRNKKLEDVVSYDQMEENKIVISEKSIEVTTLPAKNKTSEEIKSIESV
ncbi:similar to Saccharomyces cerevisiae YEL065W SIT1 Ferrioxamine B transporter, member of the ARN family of transporters that specifically recognize siderophore-iron chelates [Maudiozyma saulgeensis]|uniref:Similar to Saccharomyces cerevisiae YEL065W SIT1 Ferrioxamine B transporter, member of the ARN family of transporters that specifically recognize siderophore-iron chelates n=1 Tax=Maudiozyma saulgeensis TaxID=1789683 RepID=A0A1X7QXC9_9SACH|nr:similar to Saccharomyces cerevisiae YEL065W SIT1 Ferrioxamine B transporter, member of the ARN family of transporters that specifically recognize siderophore-iron chelates [Kazachstania saulgeensis]